jgi:hypothetical protein
MGRVAQCWGPAAGCGRPNNTRVISGTRPDHPHFSSPGGPISFTQTLPFRIKRLKGERNLAMPHFSRQKLASSLHGSRDRGYDEMTSFRVFAIAAIAAMTSLGQTRISLRTQSGDADLSGMQHVRPVPVVSSLPATCSVGEVVFQTAGSGSNLWGCAAANSWSQQGGGEASPVLQVSRTSMKVLTVGSTCQASAPCRVRMGSVVYLISAPASVTLAQGTGTLLLYISRQGLLTAAANATSSLSVSCDPGCQAAAGVTDFPAGSIPIWSWPATADVWGSTGVDYRATLSAGQRIIAGSNISIAETPSAVTIASTVSLPVQTIVNGTTLRLGGTIPESATASLFGAGSALANGSGSGTVFGANVPGGFAGDLAHWQVGGESRFRWDSGGGFSAAKSGEQVTWWGNSAAAANSGFRLAIQGNNSNNQMEFGSGATRNFLIADGTGKVGLGTTAPSPGQADLLIQDNTAGSGTTQVQIQAGAGQDRDLLQFRSYGGTTVARVTAEGALTLLPSGTRPTCSSSTRGTIWFSMAGPGMADSLAVCVKTAAEQYTWSILN